MSRKKRSNDRGCDRQLPKAGHKSKLTNGCRHEWLPFGLKLMASGHLHVTLRCDKCKKTHYRRTRRGAA
jgi:hypothetical protein